MAGNFTLPSTFLLTVLLTVGLAFFIRASIKERIETLEFKLDQDLATIATQFTTHFQQRAYRLVEPDTVIPSPEVADLDPVEADPVEADLAESHRLIFEGVVAPSLFMAIFLSSLAAVGFLCIALVLVISAPQWPWLWFSIPLLSPLAGVFYWKGAQRLERVALAFAPGPGGSSGHWVTVTGHRDELTALRQAFRIPRPQGSH